MRKLATLILMVCAQAGAQEPAASTGTAVVGDQEAPLGLYITPWQNSAAESAPDRPAQLLDEALLPHDADEFHRQFQYHRALSEHLERSGRVTP